MVTSSVCSDSPLLSPYSSLEDELEPVAQCLNLGAVLTTQERYSEAIVATQQVIVRIHDLEERYPQPEEGTHVLRVAPAYQADKFQQRQGEDALFLYPFLVESNPTSVRALLAVAFYNLAVAYHMTQQETSEESRLETCACYEYALALMDADPMLMDPDESFMFVYLAAAGNLAGTSSCAESCQEWNENLRNAFLSIPPYPHCPVYQHFERAATAVGTL